MTRSGFAAHAPPYAVDHGRPGTAIAASIESDAVVIDVVAPTVLPGLVAALGGYTLLRPLFEHVRTSHGERQPVFAGYAALTPEGGLEPLTDGALAISD
jgi:hypothetical protein